MIKALITYTLIDSCINMFANSLIATLNPITDIYPDSEMIADMKHAIKLHRILSIDVSHKSLVMMLIHITCLNKRMFPALYHQIVLNRMVQFLSERIKSGKMEFAGAVLIQPKFSTTYNDSIWARYGITEPVKYLGSESILDRFGLFDHDQKK